MNINIKETNLRFGALSKRNKTDIIVIHHTGSVKDMDASASQIHAWHKNQGWSGIGYHFVVRKDGSVERGRPIWAVGAHAGENGMNSHSIGIHLSGDFNAAKPTDKQIESCSMLCAYLCEQYNISIDRKHIKGHKEVGNTDCPGKHLFALLDTLVVKTNRYLCGEPSVQVLEKEVAPSKNVDIDKIACLARKYESDNDPACVYFNKGDLGGVSYGTYQFASNVGVVDNFVDWLCKYKDDKLANYGRVLKAHSTDSADFVKQWQELGTVDPGNFSRLQDEYVKEMYYDKVADKLAKENFHLDKHTDAFKAVVFARAIQNGVSGCVNLLYQECDYPNLSYVDDSYFDGDLISDIYDFLISECDSAKPDAQGVWRSPYNFVHSSHSIVEALRNRFVNERKDALAILTGKKI